MRSWRVIIALFSLMNGTFAFINMLGNPRVQALHGSDILQLVPVGLCFGVGLLLLLQRVVPARG